MPPLNYTLVVPVMPSNPIQGSGNLFFRRNGLANCREMGVLTKKPGGNLSPALTGYLRFGTNGILNIVTWIIRERVNAEKLMKQI